MSFKNKITCRSQLPVLCVVLCREQLGRGSWLLNHRNSLNYVQHSIVIQSTKSKNLPRSRTKLIQVLLTSNTRLFGAASYNTICETTKHFFYSVLFILYLVEKTTISINSFQSLNRFSVANKPKFIQIYKKNLNS